MLNSLGEGRGGEENPQVHLIIIQPPILKNLDNFPPGAFYHFTRRPPPLPPPPHYIMHCDYIKFH